MARLGDKSACIIDNGLFPELAVRLARDFGWVGYYSPWEKTSPTSKDFAIASGLEDEGVHRIDRPLALIGTTDEPDLWVFPHLSHLDMQEHLRSLGKKVWGSGEGMRLELDRWFMKDWLQKHGQNVAPAILIQGTEALRAELEANDDKYVKVSLLRGDMETFHHVTWSSTRIWFDDLVQRLGPLQEDVKFIVEDPVESDLETGTDGFFVGPAFLYPCLTGYEVKDSLYVAKVVNLSDGLPDILRKPLKAVSKYFDSSGYCNFFSTEIRVTKDGAEYLTDATCREPSPPGEIQLEIWRNLSTLIYQTTDGQPRLVPEPVAKYGVEIILKSNWSKEHFIEVSFPKSLRQWVKMFGFFKRGKSYFVAPDDYGSEEIGAVVAIGDDFDEVCATAEKRAKQVEGYQLRYEERALDDARKIVERGKKYGITW
jgi:hypothetical protein